MVTGNDSYAELNDPDRYGAGDSPDRFDVSGFRGGLFGGHGAELYSGQEPVAPPPVLPKQTSVNANWSSSGAVSPSSVGGHIADTSGGPHTGSLVRPYARTGGRTRPTHDLAIEALVSTSERGRYGDGATSPEHRSICGLCTNTRSVAEIAAHMRLPLGVVRVLIGDMASLGLVQIHESDLVIGDRPSMEFLERVLSGLRRL
jgi:hypothetical protein